MDEAFVQKELAKHREQTWNKQFKRLKKIISRYEEAPVGNVVVTAPIASFNFQRVSDCMKQLNWNWPHLLNTPTAKQLKQAAQKMIKHAQKYGLAQFSAGGLTVDNKGNVSFTTAVLTYSMVMTKWNAVGKRK